MMKKDIFLFLFLFAFIIANSQNQNLTGTKVNILDTNILKTVSNYTAYDLDLSKIDLEKEFQLNLILGQDFSWEIQLVENNLRTEGYESYLTTENGKIKCSDDIKTYKGYLKGNPKNTVRLSFYNNSIEGFIRLNDIIYYFSPLSRISKIKNRANVILVYKGSDLKEELYLGNDVVELVEEEVPNLKSINYGNPVRIVRIAAECDYEFYQNHSSNTNAYFETIINMAEDVYQSTFNIIFRIVYINTYTTSNDPFTVEFSEDSMGVFLNELQSHFITSHSDIYRDVVYLFSGKPRIGGIAGFARRPGSYGAVGDLAASYKTFAHELGHSFNGRHDPYATNCGTSNASVMCQGTKKVPLYFSSTNISRINSNISSRLITYSYFEADALCSGETFSISNIPTGYTVTWPKSSNLGFSGSSTGSPVTIVATSGGDSWVEPTLTRGGVSVSFSKDEFWAGSPNSSHMTLKLFNTDGTIVSYMCANTHYQIFIYNNSPCSTTDYTWSMPSAWTQNYAYSNYISVYTNSLPGGMVEVYANTCCENNVKVKTEYFGSGYCGGYYSMMFTPNPTTSETTLSIKSKNKEQTFEETAVWELEIYSPGQVLTQKTTKLHGSSTTIQTAGWKEGVYTVRVKLTTKENPDEILTGKLVVKK